jgi:hypothetical protein
MSSDTAILSIRLKAFIKEDDDDAETQEQKPPMKMTKYILDQKTDYFFLKTVKSMEELPG